MSLEGWVAVTHQDWFDFLAQRRRWNEVNFWTPSDYYTFRGTPGAPFFFKLKSPRNAIGGFGFFTRFHKLPDWFAWECFGEANGAPTFEAMKVRLDALRAKDRLKGRTGREQIGCIILSDAIFFPANLWVRQPDDWGSQNLRYKRYDLETGEGQRIWDECRIAATSLGGAGELPDHVHERYGSPVLITPRLGQGAFRVEVTEAYRRACAVTREHSLPALEAAHIRSYARHGPHEVRNGILLRSDIHRLFDTGYVTVTTDYHFEVSRRLKEDFENGRSYHPFHGAPVELPPRREDWPAPEFLRWHNEHIFRG